MLKWLLRRQVRHFGRRHDYDVAYLAHLLDTDTIGFLKFGLGTTLAAHRHQLPLEAHMAASLRATVAADCGTCVQLLANRALEAGVAHEIVAAVLRHDTSGLSPELATVVQFTDQVLARDPAANDNRAKIRELWGEGAVTSLGLAIAGSGMYPVFKYTTGFGQHCSGIKLGEGYRDAGPAARFEGGSMTGKLLSAMAILLGLFSLANGTWMLVGPEGWYWQIPGVPDRGPFNQHFVRDIGIVYGLCGMGLIAGGLLPARRVAFWWAPAFWFVGHAIFHVWEVLAGICAPRALIQDFAGVTLPAIAVLVLLAIAWRESAAA